MYTIWSFPHSVGVYIRTGSIGSISLVPICIASSGNNNRHLVDAYKTVLVWRCFGLPRMSAFRCHICECAAELSLENCMTRDVFALYSVEEGNGKLVPIIISYWVKLGIPRVKWPEGTFFNCCIRASLLVALLGTAGFPRPGHLRCSSRSQYSRIGKPWPFVTVSIFQ